MKIRRKTIPIKSNLKDLNNIKILHIGDLHLSGKNSRIESFISRLSKEDVDFLFITGDVIDNDKAVPWACKYLKKLKPKYGSWLCLGNHDEHDLDLRNFFAFHKMRKRLKANNIDSFVSSMKNIGIKPLLNETEDVVIGKTKVSIAGIVIPFGIDRHRPNDPFFKESLRRLSDFFAEKKNEDFNIVLTHLPDMVETIENIHGDLYLAGHTHGGQVRLPFIGPLFAFSKIQKRYDRGMFKLENSYLNVTAGLGQSRETPIRLFCPPEATIITLNCNKCI
ncbi:MAG: metallophosphoesterase [Nanoarchaeota archaeon]